MHHPTTGSGLWTPYPHAMPANAPQTDCQNCTKSVPAEFHAIDPFKEPLSCKVESISRMLTILVFLLWAKQNKLM